MEDRFWPSLCEKARAPFSCVNFSHVEAISGDFPHRIRPLVILRGERKVFSHSLGRLLPVNGSGIAADAQPESRERLL